MFDAIAPALLLFGVAFLVELCAAGYTRAVAHDRAGWALLFSAANCLLGWLLFAAVVERDVHLWPIAAAGEILGTAAMMRMGKRRL